MARKAKKEMIKAATGGGVTSEQLQHIASQHSEHQSVMDEARGELGALMKDAEERYGINRKALKTALSIKKWDPLKRREFLTKFEQYCHTLGLYDEPQSDLDLGDNRAEQQHGHA